MTRRPWMVADEPYDWRISWAAVKALVFLLVVLAACVTGFSS